MAQLNKLVKACGPVHLSRKQKEDGQIVLHDLNGVRSVVSCPHLWRQFVAKTLNTTRVTYAEGVYLREVKRSIAKLALGNKAVKHGELMAIKSGPLKIKLVKRK